jgi:hypothetical protein
MDRGLSVIDRCRSFWGVRLQGDCSFSQETQFQSGRWFNFPASFGDSAIPLGQTVIVNGGRVVRGQLRSIDSDTPTAITNFYFGFEESRTRTPPDTSNTLRTRW